MNRDGQPPRLAVVNRVERLLTAEELAKHLGVRVSWVRDRSYRGARDPIPAVRFPGSKLVRYRLSDVLAWAKERGAA